MPNGVMTVNDYHNLAQAGGSEPFNPANLSVRSLSKVLQWLHMATFRCKAGTDHVVVPVQSRLPEELDRDVMNRAIKGGEPGRIHNKIFGMTTFSKSFELDIRALDTPEQMMMYVMANASLFFEKILQQLETHIFLGDMKNPGGETIGLLDHVNDTSLPNVVKTGIANDGVSDYYSLLLYHSQYRDGVFLVLPEEGYWRNLFADNKDIGEWYVDASGAVAFCVLRPGVEKKKISDGKSEVMIQGGGVLFARMGVGIGDQRSVHKIVNVKRGWHRDVGETSKMVDAFSTVMSQFPTPGGGGMAPHIVGSRQAWADVTGFNLDGEKIRYGVNGAAMTGPEPFIHTQLYHSPVFASDLIPAETYVA